MAPFDLQLPFPITMTPPMFSSTPLFCVSLTFLSSGPRALTLTKLHHLRNMRYVSGLIIVRRVSSLLATANIILSLLGLLINFNSNIHLPQIGMLIATHQCNNDDATAQARKHKRDFAPAAFLRIIPAGTVMSGNRLPDLPSTSPTPETLPRTALAPSTPITSSQAELLLPLLLTEPANIILCPSISTQIEFDRTSLLFVKHCKA